MSRSGVNKGYRLQAWTAVCPYCGYRIPKRTRVYIAKVKIVPHYEDWRVCSECHDIRQGRQEEHSLLHVLTLSMFKEKGFKVCPSGSPEFWENLFVPLAELIKRLDNNS